DLSATFHFFAVSLLFSYFSLGVIFLLYTFFLSFSKGKSRLPLILFQVSFIFFVLYINRLLNSGPDSLYSKQSAFIAFLPQYYLLLSFSNKIYALFAFGWTFLIYLAAFLIFRKKYSGLSEIINSADTSSGRKISFSVISPLLVNAELLFVRNKTERASFYLIKNVFRNSTVMKLRTVMLFFLPLIALSVGLILNISDMIYIQETGYELYLISPSVSVVILMSLKLIISGFKIPADQDSDIDWVYDSIPLENKLLFRRGSVKFSLFFYLIPVSVISGLVLFIKIPAADIILNILYLISFSMLFTELIIRVEKSLPFTEKNPKFGSAAKYIDVISVILSGTVFFVSQIIIFKNVIFTVSAVIIFLIVYLAVTELKISKKNT
ncbi:MAG: hypothetical protein L0Y76_08660, partial [Ignavibacteria bacterium]|nr:hypothetical protein [Ignavibacteria bacterium]